MGYIITAHKDRLLRISDNEGAFITLKMRGQEAYLQQIFVPGAKRGQGIATGLLSASEHVLASKHITVINADYLESIEGVSGFLSASGFKVEKTSPVISINEEVILNNPALDSLISHKVQDAKVIRLKEFDIRLWRRLREYIDDAGIGLTSFDLAHMNQEISAAIFDRKDMIRSVLLGSTMDGIAYAQLLLTGPGEDNQIYTLAAIQNMVNTLRNPEDGFTYDRLLLATCSPGIRSFLERIGRSGVKPVLADECMYAHKRIAGDRNRPVKDVVTVKEEGSEWDWIRELSDNPMQRNISWKAPWYRKHSGR